MKKLVIIGAGGHGRVVAAIAEKTSRYQEIVFLDDADVTNSGKWAVVGKVNDYVKFLSDCEFFVAFGDNSLRKKIMEELLLQGCQLPSFIHTSAIIAEDAKIDCGSVIMAGAVINNATIIGKGVIINTSSSVDHDCIIGSYSHIAIGAHIAGEVKIGREVFVGAGVVVIPDINICEGTVLGAGATVIRNISEKGTYVGTPAKLKKYH